MQRVLISVSILCLLKSLDAACCFRSAPCVLASPCYTPESYSGVVECCNCAASNSVLCACGLRNSCIRDTADVCKTCEAKASPVCSCMKSLGKDCGCGCGSSCTCTKSYINFPEVVYPLAMLEMNPFYFSTCYSM